MVVCDYLFICKGQAVSLDSNVILDFGEGLPFRTRASPPLLGPMVCEECFAEGPSTYLFEGELGVAEVNVQHGPNEWQ